MNKIKIYLFITCLAGSLFNAAVAMDPLKTDGKTTTHQQELLATEITVPDINPSSLALKAHAREFQDVGQDNDTTNPTTALFLAASVTTRSSQAQPTLQKEIKKEAPAVVMPSKSKQGLESSKTEKRKNKKQKTTKQKKHVEKKSGCHYCCHETKQRSDLEKHEMVHENPDENFTCKDCVNGIGLEKKYPNAKFNSSRVYELHRTLHHSHIISSSNKKKYTCQWCPKCFYNKRALDQHIRTHTKERPYKCDFAGCGADFTQEENLKSHQLTHIDEKRFICDFSGCNQKFSCNDQLKTHRKTHSSKDTNFRSHNYIYIFTSDSEYMKKYKTKAQQLYNQELINQNFPDAMHFLPASKRIVNDLSKMNFIDLVNKNWNLTSFGIKIVWDLTIKKEHTDTFIASNKELKKGIKDDIEKYIHNAWKLRDHIEELVKQDNKNNSQDLSTTSSASSSSSSSSSALTMSTLPPSRTSSTSSNSKHVGKKRKREDSEDETHAEMLSSSSSSSSSSSKLALTTAAVNMTKASTSSSSSSSSSITGLPVIPPQPTPLLYAPSLAITPPRTNPGHQRT